MSESQNTETHLSISRVLWEFVFLPNVFSAKWDFWHFGHGNFWKNGFSVLYFRPIGILGNGLRKYWFDVFRQIRINQSAILWNESLFDLISILQMIYSQWTADFYGWENVTFITFILKMATHSQYRLKMGEYHKTSLSGAVTQL